MACQTMVNDRPRHHVLVSISNGRWIWLNALRNNGHFMFSWNDRMKMPIVLWQKSDRSHGQSTQSNITQKWFTNNKKAIVSLHRLNWSFNWNLRKNRKCVWERIRRNQFAPNISVRTLKSQDKFSIQSISFASAWKKVLKFSPTCCAQSTWASRVVVDDGFGGNAQRSGSHDLRPFSCVII